MVDIHGCRNEGLHRAESRNGYLHVFAVNLYSWKYPAPSCAISHCHKGTGKLVYCYHFLNVICLNEPEVVIFGVLKLPVLHSDSGGDKVKKTA